VKQFEFCPRRGDRLAHTALRELQESVALHKLMRELQTVRLERVCVAILVVHIGIGIDKRAVHPDLLSSCQAL
jgi:hypothetical protein